MAKNFGRNTLLVGLIMLGNSVRAAAQSRDYFHRVTTATARDTRPKSDGWLFPSSGLRSTAPLYRPALARTSTGNRASMSELSVLHPYTTGRAAESHDRESIGGRYSSRRQQPVPTTPTPRATAPPRSHTYYPAMRTGVSYSQPLSLTASQTMLPGNFCFGSPSHQAAAGMLHHR
jgi:hypothetical protein